MYVLGDEMFAARKFQRAIELYTEALDEDIPKNAFYVELLHSRAKAQSKIGNFSDAIDDCTLTLDIQHDKVDALLLRAECHEYLDDFTKSIQDYETLLTMNAGIYNQPLFEMVNSKITTLRVALDHEHAQEQKRYGDAEYDWKNYREALKFYDKAITLWPQNVSFCKNRINCFIKLKDYKSAIENCQMAVNVDKTFFKDYDGLINCYLIIGDIFGAERAIQKCVEAGSNDNMIEEYKEKYSDLIRLKDEAVTCYKKGELESARKISTFQSSIRLSIDFNIQLLF